MAYYDEIAKIYFLNDARKVAKKKLSEAKKDYERCCSALAKEKEQYELVFKAICSDEDLTISK